MGATSWVLGRGGARLSVRALMTASVTAVAALALALLAGALWTSRTVSRAMREAEEDVWVLAAAQQVDLTLREFHRLANLCVATGEVEVEAARRTTEEELGGALARLGVVAQGSQEARLAATLTGHVDAYLRARRALEARGLPLDQLLPALRPALERVIASSAAFQDAMRANLDETNAAVHDALRLQAVTVGATAALLVAGLAALGLGVRALVVRPLLELRDTVGRFRRGDEDVRAPACALREPHELAAGVDDMIATIVQQRRRQLEFLAGVAHDLRTPLATLKLQVQAIERQGAPVTPERLRLLDRQLDRLSRMIGDLLDATRIEAGQLELAPADVDLRQVARAVVELYGPTTQTHQVTLSCPDDAVLVRGDALRLEQVVSNLVSNAIKYAPGGGPVEVRVSALEEEAELSVSDHGVGIPPGELEEVFVPFRRREAAAAVAAGAGLGLSIVRRIVAAHGGRVEVESAPGRGSTFRVRLPHLPAPGEGPTA
ncbi:MAG: HAMP domain-containing histidine kinase [Planctomycetes bacterium]|nr:HAMP domain-containing histidine kinase [Planctomycetota bacterium]